MRLSRTSLAATPALILCATLGAACGASGSSQPSSATSSSIAATALAERRRELATMAALGTPVREISAFLWSEAAIVVGFAALLAVGLGLGLAAMLAAMLAHVFDPPPDHLTIPWAYLALLGATALGACVAAAGLVSLQIRRLPLGALLRE